MATNGEPTQANLVLYAGDTFEGDVSLVDSARAAVDLTGASGTIVVTDSDGDTAMSDSITVTDAAGGEFTWEIAAATTDAVSPGRYSYLVQLTFADGSKKTVLRGTLDVRAGV